MGLLDICICQRALKVFPVEYVRIQKNMQLKMEQLLINIHICQKALKVFHIEYFEFSQILII